VLDSTLNASISPAVTEVVQDVKILSLFLICDTNDGLFKEQIESAIVGG